MAPRRLCAPPDRPRASVPGSPTLLPGAESHRLGVELFEVLIDIVGKQMKESGELKLAGFGPVGEERLQPISTNIEDPVDRPATLRGELQLSRPAVVRVGGSADKTRPLEMLCFPCHGWSLDLKLFSQIGQPQARALNIKHIEEGHAGSIDVDARLGEQILVKPDLFEGSNERVQRRFDFADRFVATQFGRANIRTTTLYVRHTSYVSSKLPMLSKSIGGRIAAAMW